MKKMERNRLRHKAMPFKSDTLTLGTLVHFSSL